MLADSFFFSLCKALAALTQEETYDTNLRTQHGTDRWTRPASHLANQELVHRAENLSGVMRAAGESDGLVRGKFAEWEDVFGVLSGDEVRSFFSFVFRLSFAR